MDALEKPTGPASRALPFTDLLSACPTERVNAAHRIDPYWTQTLWMNHSEVSWTSYETMQRLQHGGRGRMPAADRRMTPQRGRELLLARGAYRPRRLAAVAFANLWRIVSNEQVAAAVGSAAIAVSGDDLRVAFATGLLERGTFTSPMLGVNLPKGVQLYKPADNDESAHLSRSLSYEEWVGITAGYPWTTHAHDTRHGLLATEFGLRVAEFCDIGNVVGESLSSFRLLIPPEAMPRYSDRRAADLTLIRTDGYKIAVEITANTGPHFKPKVKKWVEALLELDAAQSGLAVVFLDAQRPEKLDGHLEVTIRNVIDGVLGTTYSQKRKRVDERIAVASWSDWFPAPHHASPDFLTLTCQRPTGPSTDHWEPVSLLDEQQLPFTPVDEFAALSVLTNLNSIYGTPHWLRDQTQGSDPTGHLLTKHGITGPLRALAQGEAFPRKTPENRTTT